MGNSPSKTWNLNQAKKNSGNFFYKNLEVFQKNVLNCKNLSFVFCLFALVIFLVFFCWKFYFLLYKSMKLHKGYLFNLPKGKTEMKRMVKKNLLPSSLSGLLQAACQRRRRRICSQSWQIQFVPLGQMLIYLTIITFTFYPPINAPW